MDRTVVQTSMSWQLARFMLNAETVTTHALMDAITEQRAQHTQKWDAIQIAKHATALTPVIAFYVGREPNAAMTQLDHRAVSVKTTLSAPPTTAEFNAMPVAISVPVHSHMIASSAPRTTSTCIPMMRKATSVNSVSTTTTAITEDAGHVASTELESTTKSL
jgi:hypothetical protein